MNDNQARHRGLGCFRGAIIWLPIMILAELLAVILYYLCA